MVFLYTLISIIIIILALLCIKVIIIMDYNDEFILDIKWLFINYRIYPEKEIKETEKKPEKNKEKTKKTEKKKKEKSNVFSNFYKNQGFEGVLELIQNTASSVRGVLKRTVKAIIIKDLSIFARITGEDSAKAAIHYGTICSLIYPAVGTICSTIRVKKYHLDISPDFLGRKNKACFSAVISILPIILIFAAIIALFELIFSVLLKLFLGSRQTNGKLRKADQK